MLPEIDSQKTRIWWDGSEVEFIRWSEKSLVFSWGDTTETAVHLPRGAVVRLLKKGVLHVEGPLPGWATCPPEDADCAEYTPRSMSSLKAYSSAHFEPITLEQPAPHPESAPPAPVAASADRPEEKSSRFKTITRLIQKLGGGH